VHHNARALFAISLESHVAIGDLAPNVLAAIPQKFHKQSVADALHDQSWPSDIKGALSMTGLAEYFQLWDIIHDFYLTTKEDSDTLIQVCLPSLLQQQQPTTKPFIPKQVRVG
jgi:hypothetical protein